MFFFEQHLAPVLILQSEQFSSGNSGSNSSGSAAATATGQMGQQQNAYCSFLKAHCPCLSL